MRVRRPADLLAEEIQHLGRADVGKDPHEHWPSRYCTAGFGRSARRPRTAAAICFQS